MSSLSKNEQISNCFFCNILKSSGKFRPWLAIDQQEFFFWVFQVNWVFVANHVPKMNFFTNFFSRELFLFFFLNQVKKLRFILLQFKWSCRRPKKKSPTNPQIPFLFPIHFFFSFFCFFFNGPFSLVLLFFGKINNVSISFCFFFFTKAETPTIFIKLILKIFLY